MLPSFVSSLIWGSREEDEKERAEVEHSTSEEPGDWLLISCSKEDCSEESANSRLNSESECESHCSEGSWVVTPPAPFRPSSQSREVIHPLEDLLIEHPTMSVYHHVRTSSDVDGQTATEDGNVSETGLVVEQGACQNRNIPTNRQLVLLRNRQRHQVAAHLQIPLTLPPAPRARVVPPLPSKLTRRALHRQNTNLSSRKPGHRYHKATFRAGRRRC